MDLKMRDPDSALQGIITGPWNLSPEASFTECEEGRVFLDAVPTKHPATLYMHAPRPEKSLHNKESFIDISINGQFLPREVSDRIYQYISDKGSSGDRTVLKKKKDNLDFYKDCWFSCLPSESKISGLPLLKNTVLKQEYKLRRNYIPILFEMISGFVGPNQLKAHKIMRDFTRELPLHREREPEIETCIKQLVKFIPEKEKEKSFLDVVDLSEPLNTIGHLHIYLFVILKNSRLHSEGNQRDVHEKLVAQARNAPELNFITELAYNLPSGTEIEAHDAISNIVEDLDEEKFEQMKDRVNWRLDASGIYEKQFDEVMSIMRQRLVRTRPYQE